jgi:hypothetical protein
VISLNNVKIISWTCIVSFFLFIATGIALSNMFIISLGFVALIGFILLAVRINSDHEIITSNAINKAFRDNDFTPSKQGISYDQKQVIGINDEKMRLALLTKLPYSQDYSFEAIPFFSTIEAKVIKNNQTITTTSTSSQVLRGVAGGVIAGGLGMILGGMGAKTKSTEHIRELSLEIVVDSLLNPRIVIPFYLSEIALDATKEKDHEIINNVEDWYRIFTVIIHRNQEVRSV